VSANRQILDIKGQVKRIPAVGWMIAAALLILSLLILLHSWSQSRSGVSPIEILLGTPSGSPRDVTIVSQDGVTVYMPANATELDGTLSIAVAAPSLLLVADDTEWNVLKVVKVEFRNPDGMSLPNVFFSEPLEICFHLAEEQWQAFSESPDSFRVQHYADRSYPPGWEVLPQVTYPDRFMLCGQAKELSLFRLAVRVPAVLPVTGGIVAPVQAREENPSSSTNASQDGPADPAPAIQPQPTVAPAVEPPAERPAKDEDKEKKDEDKGNQGKGDEKKDEGTDTGDKGQGNDEGKGKDKEKKKGP
jgi:hypothetical protein